MLTVIEIVETGVYEEQSMDAVYEKSSRAGLGRIPSLDEITLHFC